MNNNNSEIKRRPKTITILCWVAIIYSLLDIATAIMLLTNYEKLIEEDYRIKELFSPGAIFSLIVINIPIIIGAVGLYKMKKWGAWLFIGANVILALVRFSYGEQTQYASGVSPYIAFIVPGLCIGIVLYFYKYLAGIDFPLPDSTSISAAAKPNHSELLAKLEQLYKMKEEGKLSEDEYLMMKNKVMLALTGKEIVSVTETKKVADETPIKTHKEKQNITDSPAQLKVTEDTGPAGKIEQLHQMKEKGMISEEEFNTMKSKILLSMIEDKVTEQTESEQKTKVEKKEGDTSSSSQSYQTRDQVQISKKLIYGGIALIILAVGFVFLYPKFSQEDDSGMNKLIGYFSGDVKKEESKTSLQNINSKKKVIQKVVIDKLTAKDESVNNCGFSGGEYPKISGLNDEKFQEKLNGILWNNVDEFKKIIKGEVSENWGDVNGFIDFEVLTNNDTLITIIQRTSWVVCGANGYGFDAYVLNADINSNRILTNDDLNISNIDINKYNKVVYNFFKKDTLLWEDINGFSSKPGNPMDYYRGNPDNSGNIPVVKNHEELNKYKFGFKNGELALIETAMPSSRATLSVYIIPMNFNSSNTKTSSEPVASLSPEQIQSSDASGIKTNDNIEKASDVVKSWIESLGKRDFETAYNLMSPSLSKSYAVFTSLNRYGGITKTKVHSVETVSSSGCNFVVVASYDSYDPSNRDGKFTERFNVNNCYNYWQITNVKNISTEYFR